MQYTISINQYAAIENGLQVDIIDLAIVDFIKKVSNTKMVQTMYEDGDMFMSIPYRRVIEELPILGIKTPDGVYRRFKRLELAGLIEMHPENAKRAMVWFKMGRNYEKLEFKPTPGFKSEPSDTNPNTLGSKSVPPPDEKPTLQYTNTIYYNNTTTTPAVESEFSTLDTTPSTPPIIPAAPPASPHTGGTLADWLHSVRTDPFIRETFTRARKVPANLFDQYFELFHLEANTKPEEYHRRKDVVEHFLNYAVAKHRIESKPTQQHVSRFNQPEPAPAYKPPKPIENLPEPKYRSR